MCFSIKSLFKPRSTYKRTSRSSPDSCQTLQPVEIVCSKDFKTDIELLDIDLFTKKNGADIDRWFAKAALLWFMAITIQKKHLGHASVNPKAIFEETESRYWRDASQNVGSNDGFHNHDSEIFRRIKAARATKNDEALTALLDQMLSDIQSSCRKLREEQVVELEAPFSPDHIQRVTTPSSTTSSNLSSEYSGDTAYVPIRTEKYLPDDFIPIPSPSVQGTPRMAQPLKETGTRTTDVPLVIDRPLPDNTIPSPKSFTQDDRPSPPPLGTEQSNSRYTSVLYQYAVDSDGQPPEYKKLAISSNRWRCDVVYNGIRGVGEARNSRVAKHIASQNICEKLGITLD